MVFSNYSYIAAALASLLEPDLASRRVLVCRGTSRDKLDIRASSSLISDRRLIVINKSEDVFTKEGHEVSAPYDVILISQNFFSRQIFDQQHPEGIAFDPYANCVIKKIVN